MQESADKQIKLYLLGKLRGEELAAFKARLKSDKDLAREVKAQKLLMKQAGGPEALLIKEQLIAIKDQMQKRRRRMIRSLLGLILAAIIAILFLAIPLFNNSNTSQDLFQQYFQVYELPFTSMGENEEEILTQAGTLYHQGDYQAALPLMQKVLATQAGDSRTRLATGICQQALGQSQEAIQTLMPLIGGQDRLYFEQARWYTALAHLQQNQIEKCRRQLIALSGNPRAPHHQQAKELLGKLNDR